jgi:DNA-binding response OmpR family regulator
MWTFWKKEQTNLIDFTSDDFDTIKLKCRIAIVDDEEIPHVKRLQQDGYNVTEFSDIEEMDGFIRKKYNVVVLDIQGVGKTLSPETEGWGILKYLKHECPHTVILVFTGADWSITKYKSQADLADDFIGKDLEFLDFKAKLDAAIKKAFSIKYHFSLEKQNLVKELSNANSMSEIESITFKFGLNREKTKTKLEKKKYNSEVVSIIDHFLSICESIIKLVKS